MNTVWLAFLTGLTTGGLSCIAVQGGLLASSIASVDHGNPDPSSVSELAVQGGHRWRHVGLFLLAKLIAYTWLGYLLGLLGSALTLSPKALGMVQIAVGLFMLGTAARLLDLHPIFRYLVIQPPKWVYRILKQKSKDESRWSPVILGALTVLMPCGVTQATMAIAIASGKPLMGAAIMGAFVLGTSPVFFVLGASLVELLKRRAFVYVAAAVVALFGILSVNGGLGLVGSFYTLQNLYTAAVTPVDKLASPQGQVAGISKGVQNVTITVTNSGYSANASTLKKGVPVHLTLHTVNANGCARAFTIPDYNISKVLPVNGTETIDFAPTKEGRLAYSCSMGMFTGSFQVIP
ncbi:hypothetical protein A2Z00_03375 [Candidatus Gottesmanbacteria bacterium RBG_13_45_10]|uniref:Urease accessory protein UreH-like transmembrane domain-containing protein n=1 Tax=Candidatus Gottesmanbacteria bacterium RBG_13_45_10 TaxID=1798370 RepID=A0A1F5ZIU2_9BACT|nr:MAG: hypothetical protein A2Z00_03375 [Candidatus Gottesmanbacteria bacterium RBG_13_45_10]